MKLTVLSDNNGTDLLESEWGLSIYITFEGQKILLDAGASDLFLTNAEKLGVPVGEVELAVLSHAHHDHGDGFVPFMEANQKAKVYLQSCCAANCYVLRDKSETDEESGETVKKHFELEYCGIPQELFDRYRERLERVHGDRQLSEHVYLISHKARGRRTIGAREKMYVKRNGKMIPDDFSHEQSLVFDTPKGLVIFNSCSHAGAAAIVQEVSRALPGRNVYALIGGFHLYEKTAAQVRAFARELAASGVEKILTGHCTGDEAYQILREELGENVSQFHAGLEMEL